MTINLKDSGSPNTNDNETMSRQGVESGNNSINSNETSTSDLNEMIFPNETENIEPEESNTSSHDINESTHGGTKPDVMPPSPFHTSSSSVYPHSQNGLKPASIMTSLSSMSFPSNNQTIPTKTLSSGESSPSNSREEHDQKDSNTSQEEDQEISQTEKSKYNALETKEEDYDIQPSDYTQESSTFITNPELNPSNDFNNSELDQESSAFITNPEMNATNDTNNSELDQESSAFITNPEVNATNTPDVLNDFELHHGSGGFDQQINAIGQSDDNADISTSNISFSRNTDDDNNLDDDPQHSDEDSISDVQRSFASLELKEGKNVTDDSNKTPEKLSIFKERRSSIKPFHDFRSHVSDDSYQIKSSYNSPHSSAKSSAVETEVLDTSPINSSHNNRYTELQESYAPTPPTSQPENHLQQKRSIVFNKSFDDDHNMPTKIKDQNSPNANSPLSYATSPGNNTYTDYSNLESTSDSGLGRQQDKSISNEVSPKKKSGNRYRNSPLRKCSTGEFDDDTFHSATIDSLDSTRYNETQAQLDRDIDIDDGAKEAAKIEKLKAKTNLSPWKRLRAPSNFGLGEQQQQQSRQMNKYQGNSKGGFGHAKSFSLASSFQHSNELTSNASSAARINELNKQVTGYKIQIRFFKQFLSNLIDKARRDSQCNGVKKDVFDLHELTDFQDNFNVLSPVDNLVQQQQQQRFDQDYTKLQEEHKGLTLHYDEIYKLNEDLYSSLEEFQAQLQDKDFQLQSLNKNYENCVGIVHEIVQLLINDPTTDEVSRIALLRCLDDQYVVNGASDTLDMKLHVIRIEISKKLEPFDNSVTSVPTTNQMTSQSNTNKSFDGMNNNFDMIQDLMQMVSTLKAEFEAKKHKVSDLEQDIQLEIEQSDRLRDNQRTIQIKFNHVCKLLEDERASKLGSYSEEMSRLRRENERLVSINATVDAKFEEYQIIIDNLQREVNEFKEYTSRRESLGDETRNPNTSNSYILKGSFAANNHNETLNEEVYLLHKEFNALQNEFNDLTQQHRKMQNDSSKTISSLTNQLADKKNEISNLKADGFVNDKLKQELDLSIEKQRILKAEKIRLSYKVDSLTEDKNKLQNTIRGLTNKVTALTVADDDHERSSVAVNDNFAKQVNILEFQLNALIQFDVYSFQKLLRSFNKIADDSSLKEPKKKIETLAKNINKGSSQTKQSNDNHADMNLIKEYHKSIFDYFARAVDIIVNDHVKLLLKENDETNKTSGYINKLHSRIDQLNMINESLSKQIDTYEANENSSSDVSTINMTMSSPRSKMRIEELSNRWKAEREARVYESKEAQRRMKELEDENMRLREMINNQHM